MNDLISRKYLYDKITELEKMAIEKLVKTPKDSPEYFRIFERFNERSNLKNEIADAPTVEAKEVVHGKWVEFDLAETMSQCTVCGLIVHCPPKANTMKFCPDCGADMRKKV